MNKERVLITIEQTASLLNISVLPLHKLRIDDELNFPNEVGHGGKIMFLRDQVLEQLERKFEENI